MTSFTGLSAFPLTPLREDVVDEAAFARLIERLSVAKVDSITGTTHFTFTSELYSRIAALAGVASIKIPGVPTDPAAARDRVAEIRSVVPVHVTIGVSGDAFAAAGLNAGCDTWYSIIGGTLPELALVITRAAQDRRAADATGESARLEPIWSLFREFGGSLRVVAAIAEQLGLAPRGCLPLPIQGLNDGRRARLAGVLTELGLDYEAGDSV